MLPVAGYQPWSGSADIRLSLPQHHVALRAVQWEVAPLSGQPELRRHRGHTLHLVLGPESSGAEQLHPCRERIRQSHSRKSRTATLGLGLIGIISVSVYSNVSFRQVGRARRSHPEDVGHVTTKDSVGRITPAVSASERRKSLKLVRGQSTKRTGKCVCLVADG